ncbi:MAG: type II secretion system protein [bacterium]
MKVFKKKYGYTLIEIVIVIAIMGVLSIIIYSSFDVSKAQSRDQKRVTDIKSLQIALEQYFRIYGIYPTSINTLVPNYISSIPTDSNNNYENNYFPITKTSGSSNCISYQLWAKFEKNNSYLDSKKGFDSTLSTLPHIMYECGSGHNKINASSTILIYDVMP